MSIKISDFVKSPCLQVALLHYFHLHFYGLCECCHSMHLLLEFLNLLSQHFSSILIFFYVLTFILIDQFSIEILFFLILPHLIALWLSLRFLFEFVEVWCFVIHLSINVLCFTECLANCFEFFFSCKMLGGENGFFVRGVIFSMNLDLLICVHLPTP